MPDARNQQQRNPQASAQAKAALRQTNQQFLTEIGQLAKQAQQVEPDQSLKLLASQIDTLSQQMKFNDQTEQGLGQQPAQAQLRQSNRQFLQEIGQLAQELQQKSTKQQVKQMATRITQCCNQIQANEAQGQEL